MASLSEATEWLSSPLTTAGSSAAASFWSTLSTLPKAAAEQLPPNVLSGRRLRDSNPGGAD
jgi:hypothetical protein